MIGKEAQAIVTELQRIVTEIAPKSVNKVMYGGMVYARSATQSKSLFCGIFVRKDYVTLELDGGPNLLDPAGVLEGVGKTRRHLKLHNFADIKEKKVKVFIKQAFGMH
ncbi:MAG: DUF1801 domain-containing protein [Candidatus Moraniibacteriota bacterium]